MTWTAIVERPLDLDSLVARVQGDRTGAMSVFIGTVRSEHNGCEVTGIDYSAYHAMAQKELAAIVSEAERTWDGTGIAVEHRLGRLRVREASVIIVAAHARRAHVHAATAYVIEQMKKRVPIWKREHYADGTREWVHAGTGKPESETGESSLVASLEQGA